MRQAKIFPVLFLVLFLSERALAQSVRWDPPGGSLRVSRLTELSLVFEDSKPDQGPAVRLPRVDGLDFGTPSVSQQSSFSFGTGGGSGSSTYSLTYTVRPAKRGADRIPAFEVETNKGRLKVPEAAFTVEDAPSGGSGGGVTLGDLASATLSTPKSNLWAGEVFPVTHSLSIVRNRYNGLDPAVQWQPAPIIAEDWSKPNLAETVVRGERRAVNTQTTRAYAKEPGHYTLGPTSQMVSLVVGTSGFGPFAAPLAEPRQLLTRPVELNVRPLPAAPAGFTGAVGQFTFTSKIVPLSGAVNEPITWTIELAGTGNWPDIAGLPSREVSNDFSVVQPKSKRTMKDGALFEGVLSEDVVLVPTRPGAYTLGPVKFAYFDPKAGAYKTLTTDPVTVTVSAGAAAPAQASGSPQFTLPPVGAAPAGSGLPAGVPPAPPEKLPRDPIATGRHGFTPWPVRTLVMVCTGIAVVIPLLAWLVLAALRSRQTDPQRRRREARRRLAGILAGLRSAGARLPTPDFHLRNWQRETAVLWGIAHAAPGTPLLHSGVASRARDAAGVWSKLWQETDRALHGPAAPLPSDWALRAEGALRAAQVPAWNPLSLFALRNLFPNGREKPGRLNAEGLSLLTRAAGWLVLLCSLSAFPPSAFGAEPAMDAYQHGDFPAAETGWRSAITTAPSDWAARHNLGLALGQQDRWAEAAAQWTSAFLLDPRADPTRWDLALGMQHSGMAPPELVGFSRGEGAHGIARAASPGEWQLALAGAALLLAAALLLLLLHGYRRLGGWTKPVALTASLLAVLLAAAATFSLHTYGQLAHPGVALVWKQSVLHSIPTDADTSQKASPLSAGSIAVVDRTFLGWSRLVFPAGQAGWVRTDDLQLLYR